MNALEKYAAMGNSPFTRQMLSGSGLPGYSKGGPVKKDGYLTDKKGKPYARVHKGEKVVPQKKKEASTMNALEKYAAKRKLISELTKQAWLLQGGKALATKAWGAAKPVLSAIGKPVKQVATLPGRVANRLAKPVGQWAKRNPKKAIAMGGTGMGAMISDEMTDWTGKKRRADARRAARWAKQSTGAGQRTGTFVRSTLNKNN
tara:strand:+ start:70892 stop:71500 length:609 start_codon:yes stop_codon:yes gene_type:complete